MENTQGISKSTRQNYLTSCPDWNFIDSKKAIGIPTTKNGSLCNATIVNKEHIVVTKTCAFDALLHIVASGTRMRENYKQDIGELVPKNLFLKLVLDILKRGKINANDYSAKAKILCNIPIYNKQQWKLCTRGIAFLNANSNVAHLAEYLFQDVPSFMRSYNCLNCGHNYSNRSATYNINVDVILKESRRYSGGCR